MPDPPPTPAPPAPATDPLDRLFGDVQSILRDIRKEQAAHAARIGTLEGNVAAIAKEVGGSLELRFKKWLEDEA